MKTIDSHPKRKRKEGKRIRNDKENRPRTNTLKLVLLENCFLHS